MCIHKIFRTLPCIIDDESGIMFTINVETGSLDWFGEFY